MLRIIIKDTELLICIKEGASVKFISLRLWSQVFTVHARRSEGDHSQWHGSQLDKTWDRLQPTSTNRCTDEWRKGATTGCVNLINLYRFHLKCSTQNLIIHQICLVLPTRTDETMRPTAAGAWKILWNESSWNVKHHQTAADSKGHNNKNMNDLLLNKNRILSSRSHRHWYPKTIRWSCSV